jgi:hypothetical protein
MSPRAMVTALLFTNLLSSIDTDKFYAVISNAAAVGFLNVFGEALNAQQAGPA